MVVSVNYVKQNCDSVAELSAFLTDSFKANTVKPWLTQDSGMESNLAQKQHLHSSNTAVRHHTFSSWHPAISRINQLSPCGLHIVSGLREAEVTDQTVFTGLQRVLLRSYLIYLPNLFTL